MPYIMNALDNEVKVQAHGKWFTFKPREIKNMHSPNLAMFLATNRGEDGLVDISDETMELDKKSIEYMEYIEKRRIEGIQKRVQKLEFMKQNLLSSLRYDLEVKNIKADPLTFASKGEVAAIKELVSLKEHQQKDITNNADELRKLLDKSEELDKVK